MAQLLSILVKLTLQRENKKVLVDEVMITSEYYTLINGYKIPSYTPAFSCTVQKGLRKRTLGSRSYTSYDSWAPAKSLSLYCKQINRVSNELNGQPLKLLAYASNVFCVFRTRHTSCHLGFRQPDENNLVIPKIFYLQLFNKTHKHLR